MLPVTLAVRLGKRLQTAWAEPPGLMADADAAWQELEECFTRARRARFLLRRATAMNLSCSLPELRLEWTSQFENLQSRIMRFESEHASSAKSRPDLKHWIHEIRQLEDEFGTVEVRWKESVLRATTEPIVLEGITLGSFAIDFVWSRAGRSDGAPCFQIVALEPNPAASKSNVTHPHVQDESLCAGDALHPLEEAIESGRLADAFLLVRSVLDTYNRRSPFVPLADWNGVTCSDCDGRIGEGESTSCGACDCNLCEDCVASCAACSSTRCRGCLEDCSVCQDACCPACRISTDTERMVCPECLAVCTGCNERVASDELAEESRLCPTCTAKSENEDEANDETPIAATVAEVPHDGS